MHWLTLTIEQAAAPLLGMTAGSLALVGLAWRGGGRVTMAGWALWPSVALAGCAWKLGGLSGHDKLCFYLGGVASLAAAAGLVALVAAVTLGLVAWWRRHVPLARLALAALLLCPSGFAPVWLAVNTSARPRSAAWVTMALFGLGLVAVGLAARTSERPRAFAVLGACLAPFCGGAAARAWGVWCAEAAAHGW